MLGCLKKWWVECTLIFLLVVAYHTWIFNFGFLTSGDWWFHHQEFLRDFLSLPQIWDSHVSFGAIDVMPSFDFIKCIYGVFALLWDYSVLERLVYFWPIVIFSYFGIITLGRYIFKKDNVGLFFFGLIFLFNTYTLSMQTSFITYAVAYALCPLAFYFFIKTLQGDLQFKKVVITSLLLFVMSLYEIRAVIAFSFFLFVYSLYTFINTRTDRLRVVINFVSIYSLLALLNAYLFIAFTNFGSGEVSSTVNLFAAFNSILDSLSLHSYAWQGNIFLPFELVAFHKIIPSFYFFIITILGFSGVLLSRSDKKDKGFILFLLTASLLGIFLLKQQNAPFGIVYELAFKYIPTFSLFRESNKFIINLMLPFSILFGYSMSMILLRLKQQSHRIAVFVLVLSLILINLKPILSKEIGTLFVARKMPSDYLIFKEFVLGQNDFFRTSWLPTYSRWSYGANNKPIISGVEIIQNKWNDYVSFKNNGHYNWPLYDQITEILRVRNANNLFDVGGIKYVIVPPRDIANNDDFFMDYGGREDSEIRQRYIERLDKISWLHKIDIGTKELVVYENTEYRPHLYITPKEESIDEYIPFSLIDDSKQKNPTQYSVHLKNISQPLFVNFSESYHPEWKARVGDFSWYGALGKNYFLPDEFHVKNDATLSSFSIDPEYIRSHYPPSAYVVNPDGSIDIDLTLYFRPQSYFYIGLIISVTTLLGCIMYLLISFFRRPKKIISQEETISLEGDV